MAQQHRVTEIQSVNGFDAPDDNKIKHRSQAECLWAVLDILRNIQLMRSR